MTRRDGFTLIELLVVMTIIAILLSLVAPRYFHSIDKSREAVLREDLATLRDLIDKHYADTGKYPDSLKALVDKKYLRSIPVDPLTGSTETWMVLSDNTGKGGVFDVRSGATGKARDGSFYSEW